MRVFVTGMGTQLGAAVAARLEDDVRVEAVSGIDTDPPRVRLRRAEFQRVDARDAVRTAAALTAFAPDVLVHVGVFEPGGRWLSPAAEARTSAGTGAVMDAARQLPSLSRIVVRSGIEVYGRGRGSVDTPSETTPPRPTTGFGRSLLSVEQVSEAAARAAGVPRVAVRLAPVVGPHQPSPLGRYLRLPVVPLPGTGSSPFALVHPDDAARALAAAAFAVDLAGPHNVVAPGTTTPWRAVRAGRRAPLVVVGPRWGPPWLAVRRVAELLGTPVPDHVLELLRRGRQARVTPRIRDLGGTPVHNTVSIVEDLYAWGPAAPSPA